MHDRERHPRKRFLSPCGIQGAGRYVLVQARRPPELLRPPQSYFPKAHSSCLGATGTTDSSVLALPGHNPCAMASRKQHAKEQSRGEGSLAKDHSRAGCGWVTASFIQFSGAPGKEASRSPCHGRGDRAQRGHLPPSVLPQIAEAGQGKQG